jgi:hypothetical protein
MIGFQLLGIALLLLAVVVTVAAAGRRHLSWGAAAAWTALWLAAAVAIAIPNSTMVVAHALGIQRGADLVFYSAILAMFAGFFVVFVRLRRIEQDLTRVVRHVAIRDAVEPGTQSEDDGAPPPGR